MKEHLIKLFMLVGAIVIIFFVWFGLRTIDQQASEIDELKKEIEMHEDHITLLEESNIQKDSIITESENEKIENVAHIFLKSFYHIKKDNFDKRKKDAESILTMDMFEKYFSYEEKEIPFDNELNDYRIYSWNDDQKANAIAVFSNTMKNKNSGQSDKYKTTIELFFIKDGDSWKVNKFEQINAEPL